MDCGANIIHKLFIWVFALSPLLPCPSPPPPTPHFLYQLQLPLSIVLSISLYYTILYYTRCMVWLYIHLFNAKFTPKSDRRCGWGDVRADSRSLHTPRLQVASEGVLAETWTTRKLGREAGVWGGGVIAGILYAASSLGCFADVRKDRVFVVVVVVF